MVRGAGCGFGGVGDYVEVFEAGGGLCEFVVGEAAGAGFGFVEQACYKSCDLRGGEGAARSIGGVGGACGNSECVQAGDVVDGEAVGDVGEVCAGWVGQGCLRMSRQRRAKNAAIWALVRILCGLKVPSVVPLESCRAFGAQDVLRGVIIVGDIAELHDTRAVTQRDAGVLRSGGRVGDDQTRRDGRDDRYVHQHRQSAWCGSVL